MDLHLNVNWSLNRNVKLWQWYRQALSSRGLVSGVA